MKLSVQFFIITLVLAVVYVVFVTLSMNAELVIQTIIGSFPISYKINLLFALLQGLWTAMSGVGLAVLFMTAMLTGANITLLGQRIRELNTFRNLHIVVGGNSLLGIVGSGCAACGLPILSLVGLSGSLAYLPLKGAEFSYLAVIFLSISLVFLIRTNTNNQVCAIGTNKI